MKRIIYLLMLVTISPTFGHSQERILPPLALIDLPTAGTLDRGSYVSSLRLYPNGGVLGSLGIGLSDRFYFGISFGGENIIGEGKVNWNPEPGLQFVYRMIDESMMLPAMTIGYNSQGYGPYKETFDEYKVDRYTIKSRGFYAVASKNYAFLGDLSFHGGINYSMEKYDEDEDLNFFAGIIKSLNTELMLLAEYDFAMNDNDLHSLGTGKGYFNIGIRWLFANRLSLQFQLKNILENKSNVPYSNREIKIAYLEYF